MFWAFFSCVRVCRVFGLGRDCLVSTVRLYDSILVIITCFLTFIRELVPFSGDGLVFEGMECGMVILRDMLEEYLYLDLFYLPVPDNIL